MSRINKSKLNPHDAKSDQANNENDQITYKSTEGIAKGYRLRAETHDLVDRLQEEIQGTKDEVISRACESLFEQLKAKNNSPS